MVFISELEIQLKELDSADGKADPSLQKVKELEKQIRMIRQEKEEAVKVRNNACIM